MGNYRYRKVLFLQKLPLILCVIVNVSYAEKFTEIPATNIKIDEIPYLKYYLELVINQYHTKTIMSVIMKDGEYYLPKKELEALGLNYSKFTNESQFNLAEVRHLGVDLAEDWVRLNLINDQKIVNYQSQSQQLHLTLNPDWLPQQMVGKSSFANRVPSQSATGFLSNFEAYLSIPYEGSRSFNLYSEQKYFNALGALNNSGLFQYSDVKDGPQDYIRYDTTWRFDNEDKIYSLEFGDIYTATKNSWVNSVRVGGIQLRKNYSIRPDLITYPLPQFKGEVGLPSTVDLFINGSQTSSNQLQPGPFLITNVPFINGRGEAVVVTTDAVGRQISTTVPFYVTGELLQKGLFDYAISTGVIRENFGVKNFDYGDVVSNIDARYGLTNSFTGEFHAEGNHKLLNTGVGAVLKLNNYGVLNTSYTTSMLDELKLEDFVSENLKGHQFTVGYQYQQKYFGFLISHSIRSKDYFNIASYYGSNPILDNAIKNTNASFFVSSKHLGSLGVGYFKVSRSKDDEAELLSLSWSPKLNKNAIGATVSLSAIQNLIDKSWTGAIQLAVPLGKTPHRINVGHEYSQQNADSTSLNYSYQMPSTGGFGVDVMHRYNHDGYTYNQGQIRYRNDYVYFDAGISGEKNFNQWYGLSTSFAWLKDQLFIANKLGESFALVNTNEMENIPILFENSLVGYSNRKGHFFVSNVAPYYNAKYSIDPLNLPTNIETPIIEQRASARLGSGIVVDFPVKRIQSASVYLKLEDDTPVMVGAQVQQAGKNTTYVGMDGIVFISQLEQTNILDITLTDGRQCRAQFEANLNSVDMQFIENVRCQLQGDKYD